MAQRLDPLHRPAARQRGHRDQQVLRVAGGLGAEPPADVGGDDAAGLDRQPDATLALEPLPR